MLPCKALSVEELAGFPQADLEAHLTVLYKALHKASSASSSSAPSSSNAAAEKLNMLGNPAKLFDSFTQYLIHLYPSVHVAHLSAYLCAISPNAEVANIVVNTHFLSLILRLIRPSQPPSRSSSKQSSALSNGLSSTSGNVSSGMPKFRISTIISLDF